MLCAYCLDNAWEWCNDAIDDREVAFRLMTSLIAAYGKRLTATVTFTVRIANGFPDFYIVLTWRRGDVHPRPPEQLKRPVLAC